MTKCLRTGSRKPLVLRRVLVISLAFVGVLWAELDPPVLVHSLEYPLPALHAGIAGRVTLNCRVLSNGEVEVVHVVSGPKVLADAAIANVRQWRFRSAPASKSVRIVYQFEIKGVFEGGRLVSTFSFEYPTGTVTIVAPRPVAAPSQ